jgi:steroid 5-alpha reductase family enzyme
MNSSVWLSAAVTLFLLASFTFIPAAILRKNDLADVLWGPGFPLAALAAWWIGAPTRPLDPRTGLALLLVTVWAVRLFWHVALRNLSTRHEDVRYNNWRKEWGSHWFWRSYLQVFVLQAFILFLIDSPLLLMLASGPAPLDWLCYVGTALWVWGFIFETVSDEQLRVFRKNPTNKGKLITSGLWAWSRHPNYFGEVIQWWGIFLMALTLPYGWLTVISPIAVTWLILKISGIPMLEKLMDGRPGVEEYRRRVPIFFPLPPKKSLT